MKKSMLDLSKYQDELLDVFYDDIPTSDLQGVLSVLVKKIYDEGYKDGYQVVGNLDAIINIAKDIEEDITKRLK